jgi:hypothetical protein
MKRTFLLTVAIIYALTTMAQTVEQKQQKIGNDEKKYCAFSKNGKVQLTLNGEAVTSEVTLRDGTKITPDCSIAKKDGTKGMLKAGQCIDNMGYIMKDDKTRPQNSPPSGSTGKTGK